MTPVSTVSEPERLVMSRGNVFTVTNRLGDIAPAGSRDLGLFFCDTRHLSHYELAIPGAIPTVLSAEAASAALVQVDLTATSLE